MNLTEQNIEYLVAFQGERGSYSEAAAVNFFSEGILPVPCRTFGEVFLAVDEKRADCGIIPIENSLTGSIHRNYDLLLRYDLFIVGETQLQIRHHLITLPGVELSDVRRVLSHPQALNQCENSLSRLLPDAELVATYDTAGSVHMLKETEARDAAAIAGQRAAEIYGMHVLVEGLEDNPENYTRFLILEREQLYPIGPSKTSIVFSMYNVPGALFKALIVFALRDIDLTKMESRPMQGKRWEYLFYIDFAGSLAEDRCLNALEHLQEITTFFRVLGSYPRGA
jgi:prephenate dehydratase